MALLEKEVIRFAESLDDYEHVSVVDMGGNEPHDYWLVVRDHRFELDYSIESHCDYWDVVAAVEGSSLALGCLRRRVEKEEPEERTNSFAKCVRNEALRRRGRSLRQENRPKTERSGEAA